MMTSPTITICACGNHVFANANKWAVALVSPEDAHLLEFRWSIQNGGRQDYLQSGRMRRITGRSLLHQHVPGYSGFADHRNGNGLDNRRSNLRPATRRQNQMNMRKQRHTASQFKGVSWRPKDSGWGAYIRLNGRQTWLGLFAKEEDAALAYNFAAHEHFGEFAKLNQAEA